MSLESTHSVELCHEPAASHFRISVFVRYSDTSHDNKRCSVGDLVLAAVAYCRVLTALQLDRPTKWKVCHKGHLQHGPYNSTLRALSTTSHDTPHFCCNIVNGISNKFELKH